LFLKLQDLNKDKSGYGGLCGIMCKTGFVAKAIDIICNKHKNRGWNFEN